MPEERREFRTVRWLLLLLGGACIGSLLGAIGVLATAGPSATALALFGLSILFAVGFLESAVARVVLTEDHLEIVSNFRRTVVPRSDLVRAVAEKGAPIALERSSGEWVKLPDAIANPHVKTLRAWLGHR